jgi:serine/threonine protein kinase/tetratricopeptide (TPR) repeat protein
MPSRNPDHSSLSAQQRVRIDELLDEMLDLPEADRLAALEKRPVDDPRVAEAVKGWLHAVHASSNFLTSPLRPLKEEHVQDSAVGLRLGAWRLTRLIGCGGMGDVYEAARADGEFEQRVAIKLLQRGTAGAARRFQTERQILARLEHAGIARLYDGGITPDSRLYMVMEYVEGRPITEFCAQHESSLTQRLGLLIQVCEAVSFAHRNHIIHRDLKPSNILVTADGTVKLLDFGIAQLLESQRARITQTAVTPMTPICAAPEQLTGGETTPATDVYALGLLLFELLTGAHPWMSHDTPILQAMRTVLERPAPLASRVAASHPLPAVPARRIRGDLDAIVAKALHKEPDHRYASVEGLRGDVIHFLRGEPVDVRKHAHFYVFGRTLRRYRWPVGAGIAAVLLMVVVWRIGPRPMPPVPVGNTVAVVGFTNLSRQEDDSWLDEALTEMVGTELGSVGSLQLVPQELVGDVTKGLHSPEGERGANYDAATLQRLGRRVSADYLVSGNYLVARTQRDSILRVDFVVQDVRSGTSIARFSQRANMGDLPDLVSRVGALLRAKLSGAAPNIELQEQISNAQPPSVDIAQKVSTAWLAMQHYDAAMARDELLQVVAQSPGYAPAYARLSDAWAALGYREKAVAAAQEAVDHGAGLPHDMQLQIDAVLQTAKYQWSRAADDWNALIKLEPTNSEYRLQAISTSLSAGAPDAAQATLADLRRLPGATRDPRVELAAARISCALDDAKSCADHAHEALRLALQLEAPGLTADARYELAVALMRLGSADAATADLRAAIDAYRAIGNPRGEAEARRELGTALLNANHVDEARIEYQRAMAIGQSIGDLAGVSTVYRNLCELLWEEGDRDGAQAAAKRGLEISRDTGDLKLQAWTLRALATIASNESASDEVLRNYREVTSLTERSGDLGGHVWSLAIYADMADLRGSLPEAQSTCAQALAEASRLTDPQFMIYSTYSCAIVEMDLGHADAAAQMFARVVQASEASKNHIYLSNARLMLAQIDLEQMHCENALPKLADAAKGFAEIEAKTGQAEAEALRAACFQQMGDEPQRDAALAKAQALRAGITSPLEMYMVDIVSAQLGYKKGPHNDAVARLNAMASDAAQRHWVRWSLEAQLAAWQLAQATGDKASAVTLRKDLEKSAREHHMGRILARIQQLAT